MNQRVFVSKEEIERQMALCDRLHCEIAPRGLRFYIETFGCQMNVRDSETMKGILVRMGYAEAESKEQADLILFNTCCVRDHAEKRLMGNIGALKELKESNPALIIGICGCMMQQKGMAERMLKRFPHVSLIFGPNVVFRLPEMLERVLNGERVRRRTPARTRQRAQRVRQYYLRLQQLLYLLHRAVRAWTGAQPGL